MLELGSGAALPSLAALAHGASSVHITDYPAPNLLENCRRNLEANRGELGDEAVDSRSHVFGHLWGTEEPVHLKNSVDTVIAAECLWIHEQHAELLHSIEYFLKPTGTLLMSYAHHVPGKEEADDSFFEGASSNHGLVETLRRENQMKYMWDADKRVTQYLVVLEKRPPAERE